MKRLLLAYNMTVFTPFEAGGNFSRSCSDPRMLLMELHAEQEDVRSRRRLIQERLAMRSRQISDCANEKAINNCKTVYGWLTGAAVALIFGLLFSAGAVAGCGAFGRFGLSTVLFVVGVILGLRALGEYRDVEKARRNHANRMEHYSKEYDQLNEQLYKLNLREAELEASIKSAQRYI